MGNKASITSERQARELSRVEPKRRQEVVERAAVATGGAITAAALREAATPRGLEPTPAATRAGDEAESDSEKLRRLKSTWKKCSKRDRAEFLARAQMRVEDKPISAPAAAASTDSIRRTIYEKVGAILNGYAELDRAEALLAVTELVSELISIGPGGQKEAKRPEYNTRAVKLADDVNAIISRIAHGRNDAGRLAAPAV